VGIHDEKYYSIFMTASPGKLKKTIPPSTAIPVWKIDKMLEQQRIGPPTPNEGIDRLKPYANWKDF